MCPQLSEDSSDATRRFPDPIRLSIWICKALIESLRLLFDSANCESSWELNASTPGFMNPTLKAVFSPEEVLNRVSLLKRIVRDVVDIYERRRKSKELHQEFAVISRTIRSPEIDETINTLRAELKESDRQMDLFDKEIRELGGILKDARKGLVYFYSER